MDGDLSVNKVIFLRTRTYAKEGASLVAGGPRGHIHMWNVYHGGSMMAQFPGVSTGRYGPFKLKLESTGFKLEQYLKTK